MIHCNFLQVCSGWINYIVSASRCRRRYAIFCKYQPITHFPPDELFAIRERSLVDSFRPKAYSPPPADLLKDNFERSVETATAFQNRLKALASQEAQTVFQDMLLSGFTDGKVGLYSMHHDSAVYKLGYGHPVTDRLAHM